MPAISVLVPVRDAGAFLGPSLRSLWRQTWNDIEVVAVDDGSVDGSGERLERAARRDPRLRVLHLPRVGLPRALNAGLAAARGRLVARHDADDLSHRRRLELQHAWLAAHPRTTVVGCRLRLLPPSFAGVGMRRWAEWHNQLLDHEAMAREVLVDSPLAHGTALLRRAALERAGGWRDRDWPEDVDLWVRLLAAGARLGKVPRTLYAWRQHEASATRRDPRYRRDAFDALRRTVIERQLARPGRALALVGVGSSLERWRSVLRGHPLRVHALGHPQDADRHGLAPPAVLVFGAPPARERWRRWLIARRWRESEDFVFVA